MTPKPCPDCEATLCAICRNPVIGTLYGLLGVRGECCSPKCRRTLALRQPCEACQDDRMCDACQDENMRDALRTYPGPGWQRQQGHGSRCDRWLEPQGDCSCGVA